MPERGKQVIGEAQVAEPTAGLSTLPIITFGLKDP